MLKDAALAKRDGAAEEEAELHKEVKKTWRRRQPVIDTKGRAGMDGGVSGTPPQQHPSRPFKIKDQGVSHRVWTKRQRGQSDPGSWIWVGGWGFLQRQLVQH